MCLSKVKVLRDITVFRSETMKFHGRRTREGWGGGNCPPIFCQPKKIQEYKITTYKSVYRNMAKIYS